MNKHIDSCSTDDEVISLFDIWEKLVQHKKVFWCVFFVAFVAGSSVILLTPSKYNFSQVIEVAKVPDETGRNRINVKVDETIGKIKKVFYPAAVRAYNLQATKTASNEENFLMVENVGDGALLLSINGPLKNSDRYKFILSKVIENFSNDTKGYIDFRKKTLSDTKLNLEHRLDEINALYKNITARYFIEGNKRKNPISSEEESKILATYLNDQNSFMVQLNNINALQTQIINTYNTRAVTDMVVSDRPVGPSKPVLLVLMSIVSFFFAFFGVFVANFMGNLKNYSNKHS